MSPAQVRTIVALCSILVFCIGIVFEGSRFTDTQKPKTFPNMSVNESDMYAQLYRAIEEVVSAEWYSVVCMCLSVIWITATFIVYMCYGKHPNGDDDEGRALLEDRHGHCYKSGKFLLLGLMLFATGAIILSVIHCMAMFSYLCSTLAGKFYSIVSILYIVAQVLLINFAQEKRSSVFSKRCEVVHGTLLFLTIVSNFVLYIRIFIDSKEGLQLNYEAPTFSPGHLIPIGPAMSREFCNVSDTDPNYDFINLFHQANAYLFPFYLEFTLTSSALLATMWIEREKLSGGSSERPESPLHQYPSESLINQHQTDRRTVSSKPALAIGFFIGVVGTVVIILMMHYVSHGSHPEKPLYIFRIFMAFVMTVSCIIGIAGLWNSEERRAQTQLDEILLFVAVIGVFAFGIFELLASISCLRSGDKDSAKYRQDALFTMLENFLWIIQSSLQVFFVVMAFHKKPRNIPQLFGIAQTAVLSTFIGTLNFGMWGLDTVHVEGHIRSLYSHSVLERLNELEDKYLGSEIWTLIILVLYPLRIFFRIHSVATFYQAFKLHRILPN